MTFAVHYSSTYGKIALVLWPFSLLSQRMMIFPSIPCFLSMQLRHTCYSASVMINLLPPPSSPKLHVQSIHKAWVCHQCCIACGMILTHHANWCFSSRTCPIGVISQQYLHLSDVDKAQVHLKPLLRWEIWFAAYCPHVCNVLWIISQQMCLGLGSGVGFDRLGSHT